MEEKIYEIEMMLIQNTGDRNYVVECVGRNHQAVRLNYSQVEGVEIGGRLPIEIKQAFIQLAEKEPKVWNIKFSFPVNLKIRFAGRIAIESF